jgi:broad specificity phosphatase PhoE
MTLIALRHLPTGWNLAGRLQGRADMSIATLTAEQQEAIRQNHIALDALGPFDAIFCSTRKRTLQTAAVYGFDNPMTEALLDEFDFGRYEGWTRDEMLADVGDQWLNAPHTLVLGEKMTDLEMRIRKFLAHVSSYKRVLMFGHGCWLRGLLSLQRSGDMRDTNRVTLAENQILRFDFPSA